MKSAAFVTLLLLLGLSVEAQLIAKFGSNVTAGCIPVVVHFQDQSTGNPTSWSWNLGNGTVSSQQHPTGTYFFPGTYNIKLVVRNANGADSIVKNQYIIVHPDPVVSFYTPDTTGCFPKTIQFNDASTTASGSIQQWTWDFGDGNISSQQHPTHTYTSGGMYTVALKVVNSFGCEKTVARPNLIRLEGHTSGFSYQVLNVCQVPSDVSFTSTAAGAISWQWAFGDGSFSSLANPVHQYTSPGNYQVKLITKAAGGCVDSITNVVNIGVVAADFQITGSSCAGSAVSFLNTSSPVPISVSWSFGDGSSSTTLHPDKVYSAAGSYQVKLISDFGNCADTVIKTVIVGARPMANFTESGSLNKCGPNAIVNFSSTSTGATSYLWQFGDGSSSTLQHPTHTYTTHGIFDVSLIVKNASGCSDTITKKELVKISPPEIQSIEGIPYKGCAPYTINPTVQVNSIDPITGWLWFFGDGSTSNLASPSHVYNTPGSYDVKVVITTAGGCKDTFVYAAAVVISTKPTANFKADPLVVCAREPINFTDLSTGTVTGWYWEFGDGGTSTIQNPSHIYNDTGRFTVRLIINNNECRDTFVIEDYVKIEPPIAKFSVVLNCDTPFQRRFIDESIGAQTYQWKFGDGNTSSATNPVHVYSTPGTYKVELTVYNNSCYFTTERTIEIIDEHPVLSVADAEACKGMAVTLKAININETNIASYHWEFGDGNTATTNSAIVQHAYSSAGNYQPVLVIKDKLGCEVRATGNINIKIYGPTAGFENKPGTCVGNVVQFNNTSVGDGIHPITEWQWNYGDGSIQTYSAVPFSHSYTQAGVYGVQVRVKDSYGCYDSIMKPAVVQITKPVATFSLADSIKCSNNEVNFLNNSTGINLSYRWSFGDGTFDTIFNASHTFVTEGSYPVSLVVSDIFGCKDTAIKQQVVSNPRAFFVASDTFATCPPFLLNVTNQSEKYTSIAWNFGDGGTSSLNGPSHYYTQPGNYLLTLYAKGYGDCIDSISKTIVLKGPVGSISYSPQTICASSAVNFKASTKNSASFIWDFSDGTTLSTTDSIVSHVYDIPGYYVPKLILVDTGGCKVPILGPDTIKVMGVMAKFSVAKQFFCDSTSLQFFDSSITHFDQPVAYLWDFGNGQQSTIRNPKNSYTSPGYYPVSLTVTTQAGCSDSYKLDSAVVVVRSPNIEVEGQSAVCLNGLIDFKGEATGPDSSVLFWEWDFGNGNISNLQNPSKSFTTEGIVHVLTTARNGFGCSDTASTAILVHPLPKVSAGTDTIICLGQKHALEPTGAATYTWNNHPSLSCTSCSEPVASPEFTTSYVVTGKSEFGCEAKDTVQVTVIQPFKMLVSPSDSICSGESIRLTANGAQQYSWYPSTGLNSNNSNNPTARPSATTSYTVIGSDKYHCFTDTAWVVITVFPIPVFDIVESNVTVPVGTDVHLKTNSSSDVTQWKWMPSTGLSCTDCPEPSFTAKNDIVYTAKATNAGGCTVTDKVMVTVVCNEGNIFIPNTFSPNGDGMNDIFYPRGKGLSGIKSMKLFNRWGELVFQNNNFNANDANSGWDGSFKGVKLTPDVFIYVVEVVCDNSTIYTLKGNVTLIR